MALRSSLSLHPTPAAGSPAFNFPISDAPFVTPETFFSSSIFDSTLSFCLGLVEPGLEVLPLFDLLSSRTHAESVL